MAHALMNGTLTLPLLDSDNNSDTYSVPINSDTDPFTFTGIAVNALNQSKEFEKIHGLDKLYQKHKPSAAANTFSMVRTALITHGPNLKNFLSGLALVPLFIGNILNTETQEINVPRLSLGIVLGLLIMMANTFYNKEAAIGAAAAVGWETPSSLYEAKKRSIHLRNNIAWSLLNYTGDIAFGFTQGALIWNSSVDIMEIMPVKIAFSVIIGSFYILSSPARLDTAFNAFAKLFCSVSNFLKTLPLLVVTAAICNPYMYASGAIILDLVSNLSPSTPMGALISVAIGFLFSLPEFGIVYDKLNDFTHSLIGQSNSPSSSQRRCEHPYNFMASGLILAATTASAVLTYIMYHKKDFDIALSISLAALSAFNLIAKIAALYMFTKEPGREGLSNALLIPSRNNFDYLLKNLRTLLVRLNDKQEDELLHKQVVEAACYLLVFADMKKGTDVYLHGHVKKDFLGDADTEIARSYKETFKHDTASNLLSISGCLKHHTSNFVLKWAASIYDSFTPESPCGLVINPLMPIASETNEHNDDQSNQIRTALIIKNNFDQRSQHSPTSEKDDESSIFEGGGALSPRDYLLDLQ